MYAINAGRENRYAFRIAWQYCAATSPWKIAENIGHLRVVFLLARDGAGAERMAIRVTGLEFQSF
jgi:hypothetical protein